MIIVTRHGTFLITNTSDFKDELPDDGLELDFKIKIKSASIRDMINLIDTFPVETGWDIIEDDIDKDLPAFRFSIEVLPEDWVNLIARMGAGITYRSFKREVQEVIDDCDENSTETLTMISNIRVLTMQIYSRMFSRFKRGDWN